MGLCAAAKGFAEEVERGPEVVPVVTRRAVAVTSWVAAQELDSAVVAGLAGSLSVAEIKSSQVR